MAEVDVSSYPKPPALPASKSVPEQISQYQNIESQGLTVSKQKLDLMNTQFKIMQAELSGMANDPSITKDQAAQRLSTIAQTLGFNPKVTQHMVGELAQAKDVPTFARTSLIRGLSEIEKVNNLYGTQGSYDSGTKVQPTLNSPLINQGAPLPAGPGFRKQIPGTTPVIDAEGRATLQGATPDVVLPGEVAGPQKLLPVAPTQQNFRSDLTRETPNQVVQNRGYPAPSGPAVGQTPLFEEGKRMLAEDQSLATQKLTAVKPALAALDLIKGLRSGPGTETWNKAVAFAKANNIISTTANDPTAIYQEVNKYLNQYVQGGGTRSDADLAQRELSNPNVTQQINPALEKLTRTTVAQDRIQAARAGAWEGGNKLEDYGKHRSTFPAKMDPKAFYIDKLDDDERQKLLSDMLKNKNTSEGKRFWQSLEVAKRSGVLGIN